MHPTTSEIVARYECDNVPDELFRVQYGDSTSLRARTRPAFQTRREFKKTVERHLIWANREPTPFVSTFGDRQHAINWAKQRVSNGMSNEAVMLKLAVNRLGHMFRVRDLVERRGVETNPPESMYRDEYLVLQEIDPASVRPAETIILNSSRHEESDDSSDDSSASSDDSSASSDDSSASSDDSSHSNDSGASSDDELNETFSRLQGL